MSAEPVYPYGHSEPFSSSAPDPRYQGALAPLAGPEARSSLQEAAESIGNAVGKAVETVQRFPERLQIMKARFTVIRGRAQRDVAVKTGELKQEAAQKVSEARNRADHLVHQYPLQTIAAMAGVGLLLGIMLRIWRDHAD